MVWEHVPLFFPVIVHFSQRAGNTAAHCLMYTLTVLTLKTLNKVENCIIALSNEKETKIVLSNITKQMYNKLHQQNLLSKQCKQPFIYHEERGHLGRGHLGRGFPVGKGWEI